ncbi:PREDICTED: uncharacterized protein LOC18597762 isoform X1 [Theobroma cacao]|uniref:Uncharacterized protein LOC18597762 isoform X1 n=1 Tax=Theobroma cacao TaxID=3641 RepID=A0AB32V230_THECC|nr:PREDICTED: uncharacterized protein LOC18597762 isoform X1 [Theobroma cacao]XP_017976151.1 PREDICTED: uncharacterized protein LOC18597762 isoform X1 [Theobroma cacao]
MGKHMRHKSAGNPFPHGHPGCMWRMLQVLNYQHWHWRVIKRRLTYKKHEGRKSDAVAENPGDDAQASTADDSSKRRKAEGANSKVEGKKRQSSPASKSSVKSRLKALITEEMSKRKGRGRHRRSSTCPAGSQLTGTGSDLLAEAHTDDPLPEIALNDESPRVGDENKEISSDSSSEDQVLPKSSEEPCTSDENGEECGIMFSGNDSSHEQVDESEKLSIEKAIFCHDLNDRKQAFLKQKSISSKELTKDGSAHQSKYFTDARDIINMNKGFLLTILQDPGSPLAHYFHKQQAISAKMGITKSGTFPSHGSSSRRGSGPRKQNHVRDGQKPPDHESTEDICRKSMPLKAADHRADGIHQLNQANAEVPDMTTSGSSSNHLKQKSDGNQVAKKRFKHLKQKIKHAIRESKKERHRIAMDAVLHKIPHKKGFSKDLTKDIVDYFKNPSRIRDVFSESSTSKRRIQHERRASSFNESMDRYTQLYESSFNREAKEHISKRIQERREEEMVLPRRSAPKSLGRILSSPELHSYFYQSEDSSDAFSSDMPTTVADSTLSISSSTEQNNLDVSAALDYHSQLGTLGKSESQENLTGIRETLSVSSDQLASNSSTHSKTIAQVGKTSDELGNLIIGDIVSQSEQDSKPEIVVPITKLAEPSPIPLLNFNLEGKTASTPAEISKSQEAGLELTQSHGFPTRLDILADEEHEFKDFPKVAEGRAKFEKVETLKKDLDSDFLKDRLDTKDKDKFKYVRDVLELSGFSGDEALGTWYADDQPVDPFVYEEVKGCIFCEPVCSRDEVGGFCNHPLLFDLINEVLMELYERSYSYCPRPLSSLCHIRPMPLGHHVLEEVWTNISWYLSFETGFDKPLDYVASKDLTRSDGWMNLQAENECLGLELEELIFYDLLDELF